MIPNTVAVASSLPYVAAVCACGCGYVPVNSLHVIEIAETLSLGAGGCRMWRLHRGNEKAPSSAQDARHPVWNPRAQFRIGGMIAQQRTKQGPNLIHKATHIAIDLPGSARAFAGPTVQPYAPDALSPQQR